MRWEGGCATVSCPPMSLPAPEECLVPFSVVDEAIHLLDTPAEPWSIELELRVRGSLDEGRLRAAVAVALASHPMTRARQAPARRAQRRFLWEIRSGPDIDALHVVDCPDDVALASVRDDFQSLSVPLVEAPPLRLRLVRHPGGDILMANVNHAAMDAFGGLRVLRSVARAYAGEDDPLPPVDPLEARRLGVHLATDDGPTRARRTAALLDKARDVLASPARIAADQSSDRPGYGIHHERLSKDLTSALVDLDAPGTLNDVLLAALVMTVAGWNEEHGAPCRRVSVIVPVNLRPRDWWEEVAGNFVLMTHVAVTVTPRSTPAEVLASVRERTGRIKKGAAAALVEVLRRLPSLPLWAKRGVVGTIWLTGNRLIDTAVLSNIGPIELPSFGATPHGGDGGDGQVTEAWFSPPGRMPAGLSIGVLTVGGRLHMSFRHRHRLLGPDAVGRLADRYVSALARFVDEADAGHLEASTSDHA